VSPPMGYAVSRLARAALSAPAIATIATGRLSLATALMNDQR
jgi:hypothetical protein